MESSMGEAVAEESAKATADATKVSESILFLEYEQSISLIQSFVDASSDLPTRNSSLAALREIFDKYLECPSLLDHHVETMVKVLTQSALEHLSTIGTTEDFSRCPLPHILSAIYALSKVRGRKRIQKLLPHEVRVVEIVLKALLLLANKDDQQVHNATQAIPTEAVSSSAGPPRWESIYTLWNWIGILSLVPFDCSVVADDTLASTLIQLAKTNLSHAGPSREVAAASLASWLSRPDMEKNQLRDFIKWTRSVLDAYIQRPNDQAHVFRTMGALQTIVTILKVSTAERSTLVELFTPSLWESTMKISEEYPSNILLRKLLLKWWTRLSCAFLPPRIATWRYQRGSRSLKDNLQRALEDGKASGNTRLQSSYPGESIEEQKSGNIFFVPDQVEDAMGQVVSGLSDPSTVVRWSAAKGIGRITERLPALCGEDVLDAVLNLFDDIEKDHAWQGACLALAELARRGLLLPHRLHDVMPRLSQAVHYDIPRRQTSVGVHVRDAACYSYWALSRAYAPSVLKPFIARISQSLVVTCLLDREVNCRRAASAAFQEFVGRQGNFKHGIDIITTADYFSLGNRGASYTSIALQIAQFEEYRVPIFAELCKNKLQHWDPSIRLLASQALGKLCHTALDYVGSTVVPPLLTDSLNPRDVTLRHGSLLGLAEIVLACTDVKLRARAFPGATLSSLAELVPTIEKKRLYRGKGGEQMREAVCRFIECLACAGIPLTVPQQVKLLDSIDACIPHPSEKIQQQAVRALGALMNSYFPVDTKGPSDRLQKRVVDKYVKQVRTSINPAATRGFVLALGFLPAKLLAPSSKVLDTVLACLCRASRIDAKVGSEKDAESRRNALKSLARVCKTVGICKEGSADTGFPLVRLSKKQVDHVFKAFFSGMADYNLDRRGDVGSWSRIVAMDGLEQLSVQLTTEGSAVIETYFDKDTCVCIVGGLLKQLAEKLDSLRSHAGKCLERLLRKSDPPLPLLPKSEVLNKALKICDDRGSVNWANAAVTFPRVIQVAEVDEFFHFIISGIVVSVGCLTESVSRHATTALVGWVKEGSGTKRVERLGEAFEKLFKDHRRESRVILPLLKTIEILNSRMCIDQLMNDDGFSKRLTSNLREEEKNCTDISRLFAIISVALALLRPSDNTDGGPLAFVCSMLAHQYPRVRRHAAEHLYVRFIEAPELLGIPDGSHPALELLLSNPWDSDLEQSRAKKMAVEVAQSVGLDALVSS